MAKIGTFSPEELRDPNRRYQWERGQIDYTGIDSFDNIEKRLQEVFILLSVSCTLEQAPVNVADL